MKKKILLLLIRLVRMFNMQDKFMPELRSVPDGEVRIGRLYQHYGRIVLVKRNPNKVKAVYRNGYGSVIREDTYRKLLQNGLPCSIDEGIEGRACKLCDMEKLSLPCHCDFREGHFAGYYEVIATSKQFATPVFRPKVKIRK